MISRANKNAYFANIEGTVIVDFQFSPHKLDFGESANIFTETLTGKYGSDLLWTGGKRDDIILNMFIDRSQESIVGTKPLETKKRIRIPSFFPRPDQSSAVAQAVRNTVSSRLNRKEPEAEYSIYDAAPHMKQERINENGVLDDLAKLQFFTKPTGYESPSVIMHGNSQAGKDPLIFSEGTEQQFVAPPIVRFYHGDLWVEGYVRKLDYALSVMNQNLIPERMEAVITLAVHRSGTFKTIVFDASNFTNDNVYIG